MEVTREALERRIAQLQQEQEQMQANLNAYMGAIQDCKFWLSQLDADEKEASAEPPHNGRVPKAAESA